MLKSLINRLQRLFKGRRLTHAPEAYIAGCRARKVHPNAAYDQYAQIKEEFA
jgi:hypothetical protein